LVFTLETKHISTRDIFFLKPRQRVPQSLYSASAAAGGGGGGGLGGCEDDSGTGHCGIRWADVVFSANKRMWVEGTVKRAGGEHNAPIRRPRWKTAEVKGDGEQIDPCCCADGLIWEENRTFLSPVCVRQRDHNSFKVLGYMCLCLVAVRSRAAVRPVLKGGFQVTCLVDESRDYGQWGELKVNELVQVRSHQKRCE